MSEQKTKLPAKTPAEIAALPELVMFRVAADRNGCFAVWREGEDFWFGNDALTVHEVASFGGIVARLVDPAPLEALLQQCLRFLNDLPLSNQGAATREIICAAIEAALNPEKNDDR